MSLKINFTINNNKQIYLYSKNLYRYKVFCFIFFHLQLVSQGTRSVFMLRNVSEFIFWRHLAGLLQRMICLACVIY